MRKNRKVLFAVLLMLSIGSFTRLKGNDSIRLIQFISIFIIGVLTALLITELVKATKAK